MTFTPTGYGTQTGMIMRYNKKTVAVVTDEGAALERGTGFTAQGWRQVSGGASGYGRVVQAQVVRGLMPGILPFSRYTGGTVPSFRLLSQSIISY